MKRFLAIFIARNKEFYRDRAAFGWNLIFPFLIICGFAAMFQRGGQTQYKVGIIPPEEPIKTERTIPAGLDEHKLLKMVRFTDRRTGLDRLARHKIDLVIEEDSRPLKYWTSASSPKGRIAEGLVLSLVYPPEQMENVAIKQDIEGHGVDYIDWLFPGILAMNMMFSSLYGVGYVIVLYRKNGVLKRLKATPLTAFEYLSAQVASRLLVLLATNAVVYTGCTLLFGFQCQGAYLDLAILFTLGSTSMISLGLIIAARGESEEFTNGILNVISWPMMFLSEVWFSIEGASPWVKAVSQFLPLTHVTEGMRKIINDGASLGDLGVEVAVLAGTTVLFMSLGSWLFKWTRE